MTTSTPAGRDDPPRASSPRPIAWVDGRVVPAADATVPLLDDGFLRGDAVFEAMLVRGGRTHALEEHLARMRRSAAALDLRLPVLRRTVADLLAAWGERDGVLRLIVTRGGSVRGILSTMSWPETMSLATVRMPWRTAISGVKTLSYAANQWAVREAKEQGADDALIVDDQDGRVLELPTGAICLVHGDRITSPDPARLPILDSVTVRLLAQVTELTRTTPNLDDLLSADEVFVLSATRPVLPVHAIAHDGGEHLLEAPGAVTERARAAFEHHIGSNLDH